MTKKVLLGFVITVLFVLVLANTALATQGDSTYLAPGGVNPHGGYQVTSKKCGVCHAVHRAGVAGNGAGSEALLRADRANACTYCHISPGVSSKIVYGGVEANYNTLDFNNAHNESAVNCTTCHQVHAAASYMTSNAALTAAILIKVPGGAYDSDSDPANLGVPLVGDPKDLAVSKWCTSCHKYFVTDVAPSVLEDSHIMTATLVSSVSGTQVAWAASTYCKSCHASNTVGGSVPTASAFPHYTDGARFLTSAVTSAGVGTTAVADSQYDGVCLRCHRDGAGLGIGKNF